MNVPYLQSHCRLLTTDLDQAREQVGRMWERHDSQLRRGRTYGLRWHQATLDRVSLSYIHSASAIRLTCGPLHNVFRFAMLEEGHVQYRINGREADSTPSCGVVYAAGQELQLEIEPFRSLLLSFDGNLVDKAMALRFGGRPPIAIWPNAVGLDRPPAASLRSLCRWMGRELDQPDSPLIASPRVTASLERALLTLFLDCLETQPAFAERKMDELAKVQLRRIEEWLDAHFTQPIGVEDMAAVAGVSVRTVQSTFRRLRGCTPSEAVVGRRLRHARQLLRDAAPHTSVAAVAEACGFFHPCRFAARYAQMFGERPSETLDNARDAWPGWVNSIQNPQAEKTSLSG